MEKRKNIALRAATVLCVLVLFCAAFVGGTFARYTTNDNAADNARVAKWGIVVALNGTLFGTDYEEYSANATADKITASVSGNVHSNVNVVAPGTKSDEGLTIRLSGTPEVEYDITATTAAVSADSIQDIYLSAGRWGTMVEAYGVTADNFKYVAADPTEGIDEVVYYYTIDASGNYVKATAFDPAVTNYYELHDEVSLGAAYYPILWSLAASGADGVASENITAETNLNDVVDALLLAIEADEADNNANDTLDATYTLSWEWKFAGQNDVADTILGNLIAANAEGVVVIYDDANSYFKAPTARAADGTLNNYNTKVAFDINIVVDQVN